MSDETYKKIFSKNLNRYMEINGKTQSDLINDLGFNKSAVSTWCNGSRLPRMDKVETLARYFKINRSDLIEEKVTDGLTSRDERDIAKDLDALMNKIETGDDSPLRYNGEEIDAESKELLRDAIGMSLRHLKIINKEKYNPRKNKK